MPIKSFADTSSVSLAYALSDAANATEADLASMNYVPFTTEGFTMAKEAKTSTAITDNRRTSGSKNTKGSASGAATLEFGATPFILDMLSAALMNDWSGDEGGVQTIHDSDIKKYMVIEKTIRPDAGATKEQFHERYYGTLVNDVSVSLEASELVTMAVNTISAYADYASAVQGADGMGGSLTKAKVIPKNYEIADSSNNLKKLVLKKLTGGPLELVFQSAELQIENNVREQPGLGYEFAAGMGMGKVGVSLTGEAYYYDQSVLEAHMKNERMSGELELETAEGTFTFTFPNMIAQSPDASAGGENQDYTTSVTLTAEEGEVDGVVCSIFIKYEPK